MATDQLMDYLENGNIVNSVNYPRVALDRKAGTDRHCFLVKCDKEEAEVAEKIKGFYGDALEDFAGSKRSEFGYFIADVKAGSAAFDCDCIVKFRSL